MEKNFRNNMKAFYTALAKNKAKNLIIFILLLTTIFGAYQYRRAVLLRRQLDAAYNRAFYEMTGYVQNVEIMLQKARMTSSTQLAAATFRDVWHQANLATANLSQLPLSVGALSNTNRFLSQVADLSQAISQQNTRGTNLDDNQMKTIENLHKFALTLEDNLNDLKGDLANGNFKWENVSQEGNRVMNQNSSEMPKTFQTLDQSFQEMPTLIYDGPFSEHMNNLKAVGLTGDLATENQAANNLAVFLGKSNVRNIQKLADNKNGVINTYNFKLELRGNKDDSVAEADVSMQGGKVIWFLFNRQVSAPTLDIKKAQQIGKDFLASRGYPNMKETYYFESEGIATLNFAYSQNGVTMYPDLIKVKVALDNGEIVGFDARGYYMSHTTRNLGTPKVTEAQARAKVTRGQDVKSRGLVVIPTNYGKELYCYEFVGRLDDKDFLVYINANTGAEEQVLMIINSTDGVLTM
ncbi:MAG: germination protein YpeB [Clostridia bacterium]|nr:germination protein YpeB [Clostridia bacterium]